MGEAVAVCYKNTIRLPSTCYLQEQLKLKLSSDYDLRIFEIYPNYLSLFVQKRLASGGVTS